MVDTCGPLEQFGPILPKSGDTGGLKATISREKDAVVNRNMDYDKRSGVDKRGLPPNKSDAITKKIKYSQLKKPAGSTWRRAGLEDTIYKDDHAVVNGWGKFYLPQTVNMQVVGVVEAPCLLYDQLVLMTCEDEKLYAYDGEELHLVAPNLKALVDDEEIEYPGSKSYYKGEAFKDMTEEDWDEVKKGPVGRRLEEKYQELVKAKKSSILAKLKSMTPSHGQWGTSCK